MRLVGFPVKNDVTVRDPAWSTSLIVTQPCVDIFLVLSLKLSD